jgi:PAS domain-containing protein
MEHAITVLRGDRLGNILDINQQAELLTGYAQSDLQRINAFDHPIKGYQKRLKQWHPISRTSGTI